MKRTIAIIPARGGSKRLPGKNVRLLAGIPLLAHSILYAQANNDLINAVYVSTDDAQIRDIAQQFGALVIDRPDAISGDEEPTVSALQHVLESTGETAENIVLLQPTNPFRPQKLLEQSFEAFTKGNYASLFTVTRSHHKLGKIQNEQFVPFNYEPGQRSQDLEPLYYENGLLYICSVKTVCAGKIITESAHPFVTDADFPIADIDTISDFEYAAYLFENIKNKK